MRSHKLAALLLQSDDAEIFVNTPDCSTLHSVLDVASGFADGEPCIVVSPGECVMSADDTEGMVGLE